MLDVLAQRLTETSRCFLTLESDCPIPSPPPRVLALGPSRVTLSGAQSRAKNATMSRLIPRRRTVALRTLSLFCPCVHKVDGLSATPWARSPVS